MTRAKKILREILIILLVIASPLIILTLPSIPLFIMMRCGETSACEHYESTADVRNDSGLRERLPDAAKSIEFRSSAGGLQSYRDFVIFRFERQEDIGEWSENLMKKAGSVKSVRSRSELKHLRMAAEEEPERYKELWLGDSQTQGKLIGIPRSEAHLFDETAYIDLLNKKCYLYRNF